MDFARRGTACHFTGPERFCGIPTYQKSCKSIGKKKTQQLWDGFAGHIWAKVFVHVGEALVQLVDPAQNLELVLLNTYMEKSRL